MMFRPSGRARATMFWVSLLLLLAGGVTWRVRWVYRAIVEEVGKQIATGVTITGSNLQGWQATHLAQADLVAGILGDDPATRERRFSILSERLVRREGYGEAWLVTPQGTLSLRGTPIPHAASAFQPVARAALVRRCGPLTCVDFHAGIPSAGDTTRFVGAVVLRLPATESQFAMLRLPRVDVKERLVILAPLDGAPDSVAVVTARANNGPKLAGQVLAREALPVHVRLAFAGKPQQGRGTGVVGTDVLYAAAAVPGTSWIAVRELESKPIYRQVNIQLAIEECLIGGLVLALAGLIRNRLKAARQRRKDEITTLRADFVASASHELRTPLAQIRMFAELLRKGSLRNAEESERALRIIEKEASRLTILVDNILNYARLRRRAEEQQAMHTPVPADVALDVQQTLEAFAPLAQERGVHVVSAVEGRPHVLADSLALRQVLINFLENAVKYGPRGQTVTIGAHEEDGIVRLWVDDEGPGVPKDERERIWRAFNRGTSARESGQGGSGIGLAVVRDLVLHAGGRVSIETASSGGARFVAELPSAVAPLRALVAS